MSLSTVHIPVSGSNGVLSVCMVMVYSEREEVVPIMIDCLLYRDNVYCFILACRL